MRAMGEPQRRSRSVLRHQAWLPMGRVVRDSPEAFQGVLRRLQGELTMALFLPFAGLLITAASAWIVFCEEG